MRALRSHAIFGAGLLLALCATVAPAWATEWIAPVENPVLVLAYGARYAAGVHRGLDLASAPGAEVVAPAAGTVVFAGQVPADGGGTCGAVTVQLADGSKICLLPLDSFSTASGDVLTAGEAVGTLAESGDDSSTEPHLHLSLRQGTAYVDPTALLPVASVGSADALPVSSGERGWSGETAESSGVSFSSGDGPGPVSSPAPAPSPESEIAWYTASAISEGSRAASRANARRLESPAAGDDAQGTMEPGRQQVSTGQAGVARREPLESAGIPRASALDPWSASGSADRGRAVSWSLLGIPAIAMLATVALIALVATSRQVATARVG